MPSAVYHLLTSASVAMVLQGLEEGAWSITRPDEATQEELRRYSGGSLRVNTSLLAGVIRRHPAVQDSSYRPYTGIFQESGDSGDEEDDGPSSLIIRLAHAVLDAGANPWLDPQVFESLLVRPAPSLLQRVLAHPASPKSPWEKVTLGEEYGLPPGTPVLHGMAILGNLAGLRLLVGHGADVRSLDAEGQTALFHARHPAVVALLCELGVDPEVRNKKGLTAASSWSTRGWQPATDLQLLQKSLPALRKKRGSAPREDLVNFAQTVLSANKTKTLSEARRLGVSFAQEVDGHPLVVEIATRLRSQVADRLVSGLNEEGQYHYRPHAVQESTADWLLAENTRGGPLEGVPRALWLQGFGMLLGHFPPGRPQVSTPGELIAVLKNARGLRPFFDPVFRALSVGGGISEKGHAALSAVFARFASHSANVDQAELWVTPDEDGVMPLIVAWEEMRDWHESLGAFPGHGFSGFSANTDYRLQEHLTTLPDTHPLWTNPSAAALFSANVLSLYRKNSWGASAMRNSPGAWGMGSSSEEQHLVRVLEAGGRFPAEDPLHQIQWERLSVFLQSTASRVCARHEADLLDQSLSNPDVTSASLRKVRL